MSMKINTYLDGVLQEIPTENLKDFSIQLNYDRDKDAIIKTVNTGTHTFVADPNKAILNVINAGKAGGKGVFKGHDFRIDIEQGTTVKTVFDGYLDMTKDAKFGSIRSTITAVEKNSIEYFTKQAQSFTFERIFKEEKFFTSADFDFIPYVLNSVPNYKEAAISLLSVFAIGQQIKESIEHIIALGTEMANPFEVSSVIRMIGYVAYLITLLIAIVKLIKQLIQLIIQPVKYHAGMYALKQCQIGASFLGYSFHSPDMLESEEWKDFFWLPEKYYNPPNFDDPNILGFTKHSTINQEGFFKGTFDDFLQSLKTFFKAKLIVTTDKKIYLVDQNYSITTPAYQLRDYYQPAFAINAGDLKTYYQISFETDPSTDKNTVQNYLGTSYGVFTDPTSTSPDEIDIKPGGQIVRIPFALATRKETLTVPEKIIDDFLDAFDVLINGLITAVNDVIKVYNAIIKVINKIIKALGVVGIKVDWKIPSIPPLSPVSLGSLIENRIGMLVLEIDSTSVAKGFLMKKGSQPKFNKIYAENRTTVSAKNLWNKFHSVVSFVPTPERPNANQYYFHEFQNIPFEFKDFLQVEKNNKIFDFEGKQIEYDSLTWKPWNETGEMIVRKNELYDSTLKHTYTETNGR